MGGWIKCGELSGGSIGGCHIDWLRNRPYDEYENGNSSDDRCDCDVADDDDGYEESVNEL